MYDLILLCCLIAVCLFCLFSKGFARWSWYYGMTDPQNNINPSINNLFWYVNKYDFNS
jgi:hypothetical protein